MVRRLKFYKRKRFLAALLAVILLAIASPFIYRHFHVKTSVIPTTTNASSTNQAAPTTNTTPATSPKTSTGGGTSSTNAALVEPYGSFVSSHHPTATSQEESVCSTTAGASCYIEFTNGNNVKKLAAQTVGSDGSTSWLWTVSDAGLTSGSWKITAVATLNGQTKTSSDQIALEVQ